MVVQSQVMLQGPAGRAIWLGFDLYRGRSEMKVTDWMQSGELQRRVAGRTNWRARLRMKGREGWSVGNHSWKGNGSPAAPGHGLRGAVVGWYLPVLVMNEGTEDEEWRSQVEGTDKAGGSGQDSRRD